MASPRKGERPADNKLSLTLKPVLEDHAGQTVRGVAWRGVASNCLCALQVGDKVQAMGPFGASVLMTNHPRSHIVMICTGSAAMRAMTEWPSAKHRAGPKNTCKMRCVNAPPMWPNC